MPHRDPPIRESSAGTGAISSSPLVSTAGPSEVQWSRHGGGGGDGRRGFIRGPRWCTPPGTSRLDPPEYSVNTGVDSSRSEHYIDAENSLIKFSRDFFTHLIDAIIGS